MQKQSEKVQKERENIPQIELTTAIVMYRAYPIALQCPDCYKLGGVVRSKRTVSVLFQAERGCEVQAYSVQIVASWEGL